MSPVPVPPLRNGFRGIGIGFLASRFRVSFVSRVFSGCVPLRSEGPSEGGPSGSGFPSAA